MPELSIKLVEHRLHESYGVWSTVYESAEAAEIIRATFLAADAYKDILAVLDALYDCPDLCKLAAAVADIRVIEQMDNDEALPVLTQMRDSSRPEWLRTLAGRELSRRCAKVTTPRIDIAEGDRAVCEASEVVG